MTKSRTRFSPFFRNSELKGFLLQQIRFFRGIAMIWLDLEWHLYSCYVKWRRLYLDLWLGMKAQVILDTLETRPLQPTCLKDTHKAYADAYTHNDAIIEADWTHQCRQISVAHESLLGKAEWGQMLKFSHGAWPPKTFHNCENEVHPMCFGSQHPCEIIPQYGITLFDGSECCLDETRSFLTFTWLFFWPAHISSYVKVSLIEKFRFCLLADLTAHALFPCSKVWLWTRFFRFIRLKLLLKIWLGTHWR